MRVVARHYASLEPIAIEVAGGKIAALGPVEGVWPSDLPIVAPGFVDIQVNGYDGVDVMSETLTSDDLARLCQTLAMHGVTRFLPTVTTQSRFRIIAALQAIASACREESDIASRVAGIHIEGPYLSSEDGPRGAHPLEHCREPDVEEFKAFQEAAEGRIVLLTLSPEFKETVPFIRHLVDSGVVVAIGHTSATSDQIQKAVDAGARLSTHLGNGAHGMLRRHPNYLWDQLAEDRLVASLIVDGHHLPPSVVKTMVRAKTPDRCVLVSDATSLAGMPPGRYDDTSLGAVEMLDDGRLVVGGQRQFLAGASRPIGVGIANVMRMAGVNLAAAVNMATVHPTRLLGLDSAELSEGAPADLVLFRLADDSKEPSLDVVATVAAGQVVYGNLPE